MRHEYDDTQYVDRRAKEPESWHLKKEVSISVILALLVYLITFVVYIVRFEGRLDLYQADLAVLHQTDGRITGDIQSSVAVLREDIKELRHLVEALQRDGARK